MFGLSFDPKSNVPVFVMYLNAKILLTFYVGLLYSRSSIHTNQNVLHNFRAVTLNSTDFTTYLNGAVCFFHMFDWLFFL